MPELPELDVLAENLAARLGGARVAAVRVVSVAALKTFDPPIDSLAGLAITVGAIIVTKVTAKANSIPTD